MSEVAKALNKVPNEHSNAPAGITSDVESDSKPFCFQVAPLIVDDEAANGRRSRHFFRYEKSPSAYRCIDFLTLMIQLPMVVPYIQGTNATNQNFKRWASENGLPFLAAMPNRVKKRLSNSR